MSEEKKEQAQPEENKPSEEQKQEASPQEKPQEAKEVQSEETKPAAPEAEKKKRQKKINKMTLEELEAAIKKTQSNMGGFKSAYAQALLKRKEELTG